jgi:hypothetical protein
MAKRGVRNGRGASARHSQAQQKDLGIPAVISLVLVGIGSASGLVHALSRKLSAAVVDATANERFRNTATVAA